MPTDHEFDRLEKIASQSRYGFGVNQAMVEYTFQVFRRFMRPGATLEMGPAEGIMTDLLVGECDNLTVVEGSSLFCSQIKARHPGVTVANSLFEAYQPQMQFDNIVLGHVLEHVIDPVGLLTTVSGWLKENGRILAAVPNCRSIHRQAAVMMSLLETESSLNEADRHHGHRRVYTPEGFRQDFRAANLKIEICGGYWLKPVSNAQIEKDWSSQMLNAFMKLGEMYPDIAAETYIVATK